MPGTIEHAYMTATASPAARHFAALLKRLAPDDAPLVAELAARLVDAGQGGDVCLDLGAEPDAAELLVRLRSSPLVGRPGEWAPLILDDASRLYLYRQWEAEQRLAVDLATRAEGIRAGLDRERLADGLARLFPVGKDGVPDEQAQAAAVAVLKRFAVICGGPGTGKTTTVVKVLALLLEQAQAPLRIALTAPTGKAAARLREAISRARETLDCAPEVRAVIPLETATLHRLLGAGAAGTNFRYGDQRQLGVDVVVLDEASMVNLTLMRQLVGALPASAQLIILGDRDQLASVEAGAILADLCGSGETGRSAPFAAELARLFPAGVQQPSLLPADGAGGDFADAIVTLRQSRRFAAQGAIAELCKALNAGEGEAALRLLHSGDPALAWAELPDPATLAAACGAEVEAWVADYLAAADPAEALDRFGRFMLLCALRQGPVGSLAVNRALEAHLIRRRLIGGGKLWYAGRPVMVTRNAPGQELFNGDLGLTLPDPRAEGALRVFFSTAQGGVRALSPLSLPEHETAFAMTVHKSQGSEFDRVLLLLPGQRSELLTRELLYTAVSRARRSLKIFGEAEVFRMAAAARIVRTSGLRERLWGRR